MKSKGGRKTERGKKQSGKEEKKERKKRKKEREKERKKKRETDTNGVKERGRERDSVPVYTGF